MAVIVVACGWNSAVRADSGDLTVNPVDGDGGEVEVPPGSAAKSKNETLSSPDPVSQEPLIREKPKDWNFGISVYGWLQSIEGTVTTAGVESPPIYVPFSEFIKNTDVAFELYAEARWKRWFASFDGTWATLKGESSGSIGQLNVSVDQDLYDIHLGYDLYRRSLSGPDSGWGDPNFRETVVSLYGGARYSGSEINVGGSVLGIPFSAKVVDQRWDPVIGMRISQAWTRWLVMVIRGDVGGFGMGEAAQFTWQVEGSLGVKVSKSVYLHAGYRGLGFDTVKDGAGADLVQHGPIIGAAVAF